MGSTPAIDVNGVQCSYHAPNGRFALEESADGNGPLTTVYYRVDWPDRWNLVQALLPTCVGDQSSAGFTRTPPYQLPASLSASPNQTQWCVSVGKFLYEGSGWDESGEHAGQWAIVPATFACLPYQFADNGPTGQNDLSGQAWTITKVKPSAEVYQPSGGTYYLVPAAAPGGAPAAGTPIDEATVGFPRANVEIQVTRKFLPYFPLAVQLVGGATGSLAGGDPAASQGALGSVNRAFIAYGDQGFGAAQLLMVASEWSEPYFDCLGNQVGDWTQTYLGRVAPGSWNKAQDRTATWQPVNTESDGTGNAPFALYDFRYLPR